MNNEPLNQNQNINQVDPNNSNIVNPQNIPVENTQNQSPQQFQSSMPNQNNPVQQNPGVNQDVIIKSMHSTGNWTLIFGVLYLIAFPLAAFLFGTEKQYANQKGTLLVGGIVLGLIFGGMYIYFGNSLKKTDSNNLKSARTRLIVLSIINIFIILIGLISGGAGFLNIILAGKIINTITKFNKNRL